MSFTAVKLIALMVLMAQSHLQSEVGFVIIKIIWKFEFGNLDRICAVIHWNLFFYVA